MHDVIELVREFPIGSLVVILSVLWAGERTIKAMVNRNKPSACCDESCACRATSTDEEEE